MASTPSQTVYCSAVFGVPSYLVGNRLKDISVIKQYGKNKVVSCCILENNTPPTAEGSIRRSTLSLKRFDGAVLREKAVKIEHSENNTVTVLEYIPCGESEVSRSPFGREGTSRLQKAVTSYAVHKVTNSLNRCYVEFKSDLYIKSNEKGDEREEKELNSAIEYFWTTYLETLMLSLEAEVLSEAFPVLSGKIDTEFRKCYEAHEENFCEWASTSKQTFPREAVLENYENVLVCWSRVLQEYKHQKLIAETISADVSGARKVAEEASRQAALSEAAVEELKKKVEELSDPPCFYRPPRDCPPEAPKDKAEVEASKKRQYYNSASIPADRREDGKAAAVTNVVSAAVVPTAGSPPVMRPAPSRYSVSMLKNLFTEKGILNEGEVEVLFKVLDPKSNHFLTADEIKTILLSMDHLGLYEDQDGTQDEVERYRQDIKEVYAARYGIGSPFSSESGNAKQPSHDENETVSSALSRMVNNHNERKEAQRQKAMAHIADDTVARFCFRESGKVFFDEFCLAVMHLFKV